MKNNISPVTKHIVNKQAFFLQRNYLYHSLGILPLVKGNTLLEFGPGNGVNAIYNYSLSPKKYTLVDGNPIAIKNTETNLSEYFPNLDHIEIFHSLIEDFLHHPTYDIVICENVISNQKFPSKFVQMISQNVKPNGVLVITCNDAVSLLSETLRGLVGLFISRHINSHEAKIDYLAKYFFSHLDALKVVGRDFKDWILDNVLYSEWLMDAKLFSYEEAIVSLSNEFIFYHSSPQFYNDMRWYKVVCDRDALLDTNLMAVECYYKNMINFLDYRLNLSPHSTDLGNKISELSKNIRILCGKFLHKFEEDVLNHLVDQIEALANLIKEITPRTFRSLCSYASMIRTNQFDLMTSDSDLIEWWGRGTQYMSLIKQSDNNLL
ncbi:MAG TPA: methyltransferase domain-containing protein [Gammaproteobacteria bacterium]|nr:methyltransferase domain-containing protein [Gammaproteobacteria bacterium]